MVFYFCTCIFQMLDQGANDVSVRHADDNEQVTMATQTEDEPEVRMTYGHNVPGAIYHGAWPMGKCHWLNPAPPTDEVSSQFGGR